MIIVCNLEIVKRECLLLSDTRGPYYGLEQCLDRNTRMYIDTLKVFPNYKLASSQCRTERGTRFGTKRFPGSSSGA